MHLFTLIAAALATAFHAVAAAALPADGHAKVLRIDHAGAVIEGS